MDSLECLDEQVEEASTPISVEVDAKDMILEDSSETAVGVQPSDGPDVQAHSPSSSETSTSSSSESDEDRGIEELAETCGVELHSSARW